MKEAIEVRKGKLRQFGIDYIFNVFDEVFPNVCWILPANYEGERIIPVYAWLTLKHLDCQ